MNGPGDQFRRMNSSMMSRNSHLFAATFENLQQSRSALQFVQGSHRRLIDDLLDRNTH